jgi:riboflavin biosynthesis pyrimidine reductase
LTRAAVPESRLSTLYDRAPAGEGGLTEALRRAYDGELAFPSSSRPHVIANFVETLDGIVSFAVAGQAGGGEISGFDEADRFVMGLLRSCADAVVVGSGTLHGDSGHVRTPAFIHPGARDLYAELRARRGAPADPLNVVVTATGRVDLAEPTFRTPGLATLIVTTEEGHRRLRADHGSGLGVTRVRAVAEAGPVPPKAIVRALGDDFGVRLLLLEGGPRLFGSFVAARLLDELFLTVAPQIAGREAAGDRRPGLVEGVAFPPAAAPWFHLLTVKRAGDHLFLRLASSRE